MHHLYFSLLSLQNRSISDPSLVRSLISLLVLFYLPDLMYVGVQLAGHLEYAFKYITSSAVHVHNST